MKTVSSVKMGNNSGKDETKILFLDVDGVLNSLEYTPVQDIQSPDDIYVIEDNKLKLLKKIVNAVDCDIVISSTWKNNKKQLQKLSTKLQKYGLNHVDCTPHLPSLDRTYEIESFITKYNQNNEKQITKWIAIDDMDLMALNAKLIIIFCYYYWTIPFPFGVSS